MLGKELICFMLNLLITFFLNYWHEVYSTACLNQTLPSLSLAEGLHYLLLMIPSGRYMSVSTCCPGMIIHNVLFT